jgi:hypothetical protein
MKLLLLCVDIFGLFAWQVRGGLPDLSFIAAFFKGGNHGAFEGHEVVASLRLAINARLGAMSSNKPGILDGIYGDEDGGLVCLHGKYGSSPKWPLMPVLDAIRQALEQPSSGAVVENIRRGLTVEQRRKLVDLAQQLLSMAFSMMGGATLKAGNEQMTHVVLYGSLMLMPLIADHVNAFHIIASGFAPNSQATVADLVDQVSTAEMMLLGRACTIALDRLLRDPTTDENASKVFTANREALMLRSGQLLIEALEIVESCRTKDDAIKEQIAKITEAARPFRSQYASSWLNSAPKFIGVFVGISGGAFLVNVLFVLFSSHK